LDRTEQDRTGTKKREEERGQSYAFMFMIIMGLELGLIVG